MLGPNLVGRIRAATTIMALISIIGMALLGWFWFHPVSVLPGNHQGQVGRPGGYAAALQKRV